MLPESDYDFKEKYPYIRVDTLVSVHITSILIKESCLFVMGKFSKELK